MSKLEIIALSGVAYKVKQHWSHDIVDELKVSFLILFSVARLKTLILDVFSVLFCIDGTFCTLSGNLERVVLVLSTKYLEKWSQSDLTDPLILLLLLLITYWVGSPSYYW